MPEPIKTVLDMDIEITSPDIIDELQNITEPVEVVTNTIVGNTTQVDPQVDPQVDYFELLITEFNGSNYNDTGDLVNAAGEVVLDKSAVDEYIANLSADADSLSSNGTNVKSIVETYGLIIQDDEGKPIEYQDTQEGVATYIKDVAELAKEEGVQLGAQRLIEQYPILTDILNHLELNKGSIDGYNSTTDYSTMDINKMSDAQKETLIFKELTGVRGMDADIAKQDILLYKDASKLSDRAKNSLKVLNELDITNKKQRQTAIEQKNQLVIEQRNNAIKTIDTLLNTSVKGMQVKKTDISKIQDFLFKPYKDGKSEYEYRVHTKTAEDRLFNALLEFYDGNQSALISSKLNMEKLELLRKKAALSKNKSSGTVHKPASKGAPLDASSIDIAAHQTWRAKQPNG